MAALVQADRVKETSATTGTGTYSLAGAPAADFRTFVAGIGDGNSCFYCAYEAGVGWEVGIGLVTDATPDTLARTSVLASSNGGAAVSWSAGTRTLICTLPAAKLARLVDYQSFTSSGSWTKPAGFSANSFVRMRIHQAGGGGARHSTNNLAAGGEPGNAYDRCIPLSALGASETVTVGAGGLGRTSSNGDGAQGGTTSIGTAFSVAGALGGKNGADNTPVAPTAIDGAQTLDFTTLLRGGYTSDDGEGGVAAFAPSAGTFAGGGGGANATNTTGGTSKFGGAGGTGGASPTNGADPSGGGGAGKSVDGKNGGKGQMEIWVFAAT